MASSIRLFRVVALVVLICAAARAQTVPTTLNVRVVLVPADAQAVFGDHVTAGEKAIADEIVKSLSQRFPWNFKSGDPSTFPQLRITIDHAQDWSVEMFLVASSTSAPRKIARAVLWRPGDDESVVFPPEAQWAGKIVRVLERDLLEPDTPRIDVFNHLKTVPLGVAAPGLQVIGVQDPELGLLVLPLDYAKFQTWSLCEYTFQYARENDVPLKVISNGLGTAYQYPPNQPQFRGILVKIDPKNDAALRANIAALVRQVPAMFFITRMEEEDASLSVVPPPPQP